MTPEENVERIMVTTQRIERLAKESHRDATSRAMAVRELRAEGWSYGQIAAPTGLSRSRVAQIAQQ